MQVVILAAGSGSRLSSAPNRPPKALTPLTPTLTILGLQLHLLSRHFSLQQVQVVVGYQKEALLETFPDLRYIDNPHYREENTSKSLWRALCQIEGEDVLWLNGDVVFHPAVLDQLLLGNRTSMVVNGAVVGEEEVKYRADKEGRLVEVSKQVKDPQGEVLGINLFKKEDLLWLREQLQLCQPQDFFEKAIENGIQAGKTVWSVPVDENECAEIDFPEDLVRAKHLVQQWGFL